MKRKEKRDLLLSALEPLRDCLDPGKCAVWLATVFHGEMNRPCPSCGAVPFYGTLDILRECRRVICRSCGKGFTIWTGTLLEAAKFTPKEFILLRSALAVGLDFTGRQMLLNRRGQCVADWTKKVQKFDEIYSTPHGQGASPSE